MSGKLQCPRGCGEPMTPLPTGLSICPKGHIWQWTGTYHVGVGSKAEDMAIALRDALTRLAAAEAEAARLREAMAGAIADIDECNRCGATLSARDILSDALAEPTP